MRPDFSALVESLEFSTQCDGFSAILAPVASSGGTSRGARRQDCTEEPRHLL